jgi:hypothetical protein
VLQIDDLWVCYGLCAESISTCLQLFALLLQAEATTPFYGDRAQIIGPTRHSLEKGFHVNVQQ